mmetsp:Transcript_4102/g.7487  ORF Transcript_4102/g.7487 Transcript_4102/m.7487 type:complete len:104 (-) Transcript_4102:28-339(-)
MNIDSLSHFAFASLERQRARFANPPPRGHDTHTKNLASTSTLTPSTSASANGSAMLGRVTQATQRSLAKPQKQKAKSVHNLLYTYRPTLKSGNTIRTCTWDHG